MGRMSYLTTVKAPFHGRVVAARLGAEGIPAVLRGLSQSLGPLPSGVDVLVPAEKLDLAREILLADAVDDIFEEFDLDFAPGVPEHPHLAEEAFSAYGDWYTSERTGPRRRRTARKAIVLALVLWLIVVGCLAVVL